MTDNDEITSRTYDDLNLQERRYVIKNTNDINRRYNTSYNIDNVFCVTNIIGCDKWYFAYYDDTIFCGYNMFVVENDIAISMYLPEIDNPLTEIEWAHNNIKSSLCDNYKSLLSAR